MPQAPPRILVDANVPFAAEAFGRYGAVRLMAGRSIDRFACSEADVLIVRSVTRVDASTLDDTPVRFVGTATAGTDHLDLAYLRLRGIEVASAPGSNAESVVEWVVAALLAMGSTRGGVAGRTLGVVGCGHVGGRLIPRAAALGMDVLACDPPLAEVARAAGRDHPFLPYSQVLAEADVLSFHTPLTFDGDHPTFHLLGGPELPSTKAGVWVINTSRGAVVDGAAVEAAGRAGRVEAIALDVWEGEPEPPAALIELADLATPHIAGYGHDGKVAGARMMEEALRAWLTVEERELPPPFDWSAAAPPATLVLPAPAAADAHEWLDELARGAYDIRADDARFRSVMLNPTVDRDGRGAAFTELRRTYPERRSWAFYGVDGPIPDGLVSVVREGLGMSVLDSDTGE